MNNSLVIFYFLNLIEVRSLEGVLMDISLPWHVIKSFCGVLEGW